MQFSFLTLFPKMIEGYFCDSILKNALEKGLISIQTIQIRDFASNAYKSVDMPQIGGGAGQVLSYEVLSRAIKSLQQNVLDFGVRDEYLRLESCQNVSQNPPQEAIQDMRQNVNQNERQNTHNIGTLESKNPNLQNTQNLQNLQNPHFITPNLKSNLQSNSQPNLQDFSPHFAKQINPQTQNLAQSSPPKSSPKTPAPHIIFLSPCAKLFTQNDAKRLAQKPHIAFVCGRYEGIDERAIEMYADEVFCIGDFILTGGELAALCMCDSIARHIKGVLGNSESLQGESFENHLLEAPVFARAIKEAKSTKQNQKIQTTHLDSTFLPQNHQKNQNFTNFCAPSVYSKGNHSKISVLKNDLAVCKTRYFRPNLFEKWKIHTKNTTKKKG